MRSRNSLILVGLVAISTLGIFLLGCSSDDTLTRTINTTRSPYYTAVSGVVNEYVDSSITLVEQGLDAATVSSIVVLADILFGPAPPDSSQEEPDWLIYWYTDLQTGLGGSLLLAVDSLQFVRNGIPCTNPVGADVLTFNHYIQKVHSDTTVSYVDFEMHAGLTFSGIDGDIAAINGGVDAVVGSKYVSADSTVWQDWTVEATFTDIGVQKSHGALWENVGCPYCGSAEVTVQYTYQKDDATAVTTDWAFEITFESGTAAVQVITTNWATSYERDLCTP